MACDEKTLLLISCYADGEATPEEAARAQAHLERCTECRELVEDWRRERELFEWTFRFELPEPTVEGLGEILPEGNVMKPIEERRRLRLQWRPWSWRWNWAAAAKLAAAAMVIAIIYHFATLPPMLGKQLATGNTRQVVRMQGGIQLTLDPDSQVTRLGENEVRLDKGWVMAQVRHGNREFHIRTRYASIRDQGTRFLVGSAGEADYVIVLDGAVSTSRADWDSRGKAGDLVTEGKMRVIRPGSQVDLGLPVSPSGTPDEGSRLYDPSTPFTPSSDEDLAWEEGARDLEKRFPDLRYGGARAGGDSSVNGIRYRLMCAEAPGVKQSVAEHFVDIVKGATGGSTVRDWEFPVGYMLIDGIAGPVSVPPDFYFVRMVSESGRLSWRLDGARGTVARLPVVLEPFSKIFRSGGSSEFGSLFNRHELGASGPQRVVFGIKDWPGDEKPVMEFAEPGTSLAHAEDGRAAEQMRRDLAGIPGFGGSPSVTYLDSGRRHWLLVQWSDAAGQALADSLARLKAGGSASAVFGAISINVPSSDPVLAPGTYLLRWTRRGPAYRGQIEIVDTAGIRVLAVLPGPPSGADSNRGGSFYSSTPPKPSIGYFEFQYTARDSKDDTFPFSFAITHIKGSKWPGDKLAEGWIRLKRP